MKKYLAYIDESGDPHFNEGASKTFFVGAVILEESALPSLSKAIDHIKSTYQIPELKSRQISSLDRRRQICRKLIDTGLQVATVAVNKEHLRGDWFRYRQTLYKYVQNVLHQELYRAFGTVDVSIDRYGSPEYQQSFRTYLERKLQASLFDPQILIASADENDFIQASDVLVGSIRKALQGDFDDRGEELLDSIRPCWLIRRTIPDEGAYPKPVPELYSMVSLQACMDEAWRFLECNASSTPDPRTLTLEYLYYSALDGRSDWIYTQEILNWLGQFGFYLNDEQFRNDVTASLRDEGLVIVSSRRGLKIPQTPDDLNEYIRFSASLALPILKRLKKAIGFVSNRTPFDQVDALLGDEMARVLRQIDI